MKKLTLKSHSLLIEASEKMAKSLKIQAIMRHYSHSCESYLPSGKIYREETDTQAHMEFITEDYRFVLNAYNDDTIELYWIQNLSGKKGIGTMLMNNLLDIADEMQIKIRLIAVPFAEKKIFSKNDLYRAFIRLASYYNSFDFKRPKSNSAEFIYDPS